VHQAEDMVALIEYGDDQHGHAGGQPESLLNLMTNFVATTGTV